MRDIEPATPRAAEGAEPLKILWLTRESPLRPDRGDLLYSNGVLGALLAAGARGVMLAYARPGRPDPGVEGLEVRLLTPPDGGRLLSLFTPLPSDAYRQRSKPFVAAVKQAMNEQFDAIVIDYYTMGWTLPVIRAHPSMRQASRPVLVYLSHQDEQALRPQVAKAVGGSFAMRAVLPLDAAKGVRMDKALAAAADIITAITEEDRRTFLARAPGKTVVTLTPGYEGGIAAVTPFDGTRPRRVILVGGLIWIAKRKNLVDFLEAADPVFQAAGVELQVVGHAEPDFIDEMTARFGCVRFEGPVEALGPFIDQARIGLMPDTLGAGFKMKYLDYIFRGLPVATIRSQVVGLPPGVEEDMIAADTPIALAHAIVEAIDDVERLRTMSVGALDKCRHAFAWIDRGEALYAAIEAKRTRRRPIS